MGAGAVRTYVWCAYREWSCRVLEGIQGHEGWRTGLIVTPTNCTLKLATFARRGVPILRVDDPATCFRKPGTAYDRISRLRPGTIFHYGWSWMVPPELLALCPNVTLHPGKLPRDRGGSPLQHQIRNGETWTYVNILKMTEQPDAGPVYARDTMSLEGSIDEVWARMTVIGCRLTTSYLTSLANGTAVPLPQAEEPPTMYRRVKPEQAELTLDGRLTAAAMHNIIRAHSETDPNTYVRPAYLMVGGRPLVIERASLEAAQLPGIKDTIIVKTASDLAGKDLAALSADVMKGARALALEDRLGNRVYVTSVHVGIGG